MFAFAINRPRYQARGRLRSPAPDLQAAHRAPAFSFTSATCRANASSVKRACIAAVASASAASTSGRATRIAIASSRSARARPRSAPLLRERIRHRIGPEQLARRRCRSRICANMVTSAAAIKRRRGPPARHRPPPRTAGRARRRRSARLPSTSMWRAISAGWRISPASTALARTRSIPPALHRAGARRSTRCERRRPFRAALAAVARGGCQARAALRAKCVVEAAAELGLIFARARRDRAIAAGEFGQPRACSPARCSGVSSGSAASSCLPQAVDQRLGVSREHCSNAAAPFARIEIVGVLPLGQGHEGRLRPGASIGSARWAARSAAFCPAASPSKQSDRHVGDPPQPLELRLGQRGAERGDRLADPRLRQRDHVHIAFDHDHAVGLARGGRARGRGCRACGPCRRAGCRGS